MNRTRWWLLKDVKIPVEDHFNTNIRSGLHENKEEKDSNSSHDDQLLFSCAAKMMGIPVSAVTAVKRIRESVDARKKDQLLVVYTLAVKSLSAPRRSEAITPYEETCSILNEIDRSGLETVFASRPIVVGAGPCGLFCALTLAKAGLKPILLERGLPVERRAIDVKSYWQGGSLNPESNVQFGEGGAGTFSDGKLTTRINDPRCQTVLETFISCGAPANIAYLTKPHIGTDKLRQSVITLRNTLLGLGTTILYSAKVEQLMIKNRCIQGVLLADGTKIDSEIVVLAIGHSARDSYEMLFNTGISMTAKAFSVGVRIEHKQSDIDLARYGNHRHSKLGVAEYQLFEKVGGRTAYTFCMCPGGIVVASASEKDTIVTNGMSYYSRNKENANSAFVVSIDPSDFGSHPLDGIAYQRRLEKSAFTLGGSSGAAPIQRLEDFMKGQRTTKVGNIKPSYTGQTRLSRLDEELPSYLTDSMRKTALVFERKMCGFSVPDAILTGYETRTSSPVRILRGDNGVADGMKGLYPSGEGAGYAGGIMSASVDGIKTAEKIIKTYFTDSIS